MPEDKKPAPKSDPPEPEDYSDWSDEERAEWDSGEKFRKRHVREVADELFDRLFGNEDGGARVDPDGSDAEHPPGGGGDGGDGGDKTPTTSARVPWFERKLFAPKPKEDAK